MNDEKLELKILKSRNIACRKERDPAEHDRNDRIRIDAAFLFERFPIVHEIAKKLHANKADEKSGKSEKIKSNESEGIDEIVFRSVKDLKKSLSDLCDALRPEDDTRRDEDEKHQDPST